MDSYYISFFFPFYFFTVRVRRVNSFWAGTTLGVLSIRLCFNCWKIADLQAHSAPPSGALWACRSAIFEEMRKCGSNLECIFFQNERSKLKSLLLGGTWNTTYFDIKGHSQFDIILRGSLTWNIEHHWYRNKVFSKKLSGFRQHFYAARRPNTYNFRGPWHEILSTTDTDT